MAQCQYCGAKLVAAGMACAHCADVPEQISEKQWMAFLRGAHWFSMAAVIITPVTGLIALGLSQERSADHVILFFGLWFMQLVEVKYFADRLNGEDASPLLLNDFNVSPQDSLRRRKTFDLVAVVGVALLASAGPVALLRVILGI